MIKIRRSETADSRTCDYSQVSIETLRASTVSHMVDVQMGMAYFRELLWAAGETHDKHKMKTMEHFHAAFTGGFKDESWWNEHKQERHHLPDIEDINLIDILEHIADCVMAGKARSGKLYMNLPSASVLEKAFTNTFEMLAAEVVLELNNE